MKLHYTLLLALVYALSSCTDTYTICNENRTVQFNSYFYKKVNGQEVTANAPDLKIIDLTSNATILNNQLNTPSFSLVLNPLVDSMKFHIALSPTLQADTLTVVYTSQSKSLSTECGVISIHTISKAYTTRHTLDTVKLTNSAVVNDNLSPNTKIFF